LVDNGLKLLNLDEEIFKNIQFLIMTQKYLELLETRDLKMALLVLRNEITPLNQDISKIHRLSSLMMCASPEELRIKAEWDGKAGKSRKKLLHEIQKQISPALMLPEQRMEVLLMQAIAFQRNSCQYHNTQDNTFSLFQDHICNRNQVPNTALSTLKGHSDEVWYIDFSHDGKWLASGSKDGTVIIWDIERLAAIHVLADHEDGISFLSWSPDDSMLLSCGRDKLLKLWDIKTGTIKRTYTKHTDHVTACAWLPDGKHFLSGSPDKNLYLWNLEGNVVRAWVTPRIFSLALNHAGSHVIVVSWNTLHFYSIVGDEEEQKLLESEHITSLQVSSNDKYALVNVRSSELHIWDLERKKIVKKFSGHAHTSVVIRSCFGGVNQIFVASGSEDDIVNIWNRESGTLVGTLKGHLSIVNSVSWNPQDPFMLASASDDHTIKIWVPSVQ